MLSAPGHVPVRPRFELHARAAAVANLVERREKRLEVDEAFADDREREFALFGNTDLPIWRLYFSFSSFAEVGTRRPEKIFPSRRQI